jgi:broad specificity phosphatase PhoE
VPLELVYETHAITRDNEAGIATGWLPGCLSEAGRLSAEQLGARRRDDRIAAAYVSDLARAVDTARIALGGSGILVTLDPRLRECNYGHMNGMPREQLDRERDRHVEEPWPEGESYRDVVARTSSFLEDLAAIADGTRVLVIAHSANEWALEHLLLGADLSTRVASGMTWQPGWEFVVPSGWRAPTTT